MKDHEREFCLDMFRRVGVNTVNIRFIPEIDSILKGMMYAYQLGKTHQKESIKGIPKGLKVF